MDEPDLERLEYERRWYTEHTALLITTLKWALLGVVAGVCVGLGTRAFLWSLAASTDLMRHAFGGARPYYVLPVVLPAVVWLIRHFAPAARGHGTEAVIAAVHQRSGKVDWGVAPIKLVATVLTLAFGGSVGKEGPCAQIGAAITSLFADLLRLSNEDRRRLVICGIAAGFAAVFGTPVSGALFGVEVLYLGRIEYPVLFPSLVAGIVAHLVTTSPPPVATVAEGAGSISLSHPQLVMLAIGFGIVFGLVAFALIEAMRLLEKALRRFASHPYLIAAGGGAALVLIYLLAGDIVSGLGTETIQTALGGASRIPPLTFVLKIVATAVTLETGGSGGIVTPLFFIGSTSGAALAQAAHLPTGVFAAFGFVAVVAAAANTPVAAAVMAMELLPASIGVYAALSAVTAFLVVGHRSVYASQKLGFSKSAGLEVTLDVFVGDLDPRTVRIRKGSLTERAHRILGYRRRPPNA